MLKILVVGYGSIGKRHVKNLLSKFDVEIIVNTKQHDSFLKQNHFVTSSSLSKCILEKPDIAIIANVTSMHMKTALILAKSGCHLLIEKPLSNSITGIKDLIKITRSMKLTTLIGCNLRFHPCIELLKQLIDKKTIGKIISVKIENGSYLPNWHPYEDYRKSYSANDSLGGGVVLTNIHEIDYLYWFFGKVKEIFSITGKFSDLQIKSDDLSAILLRFSNNIIAEIHLDYFQRPDFRSCKIIGTKGTLYWDSDINSVKLYDINKKKWITKLSIKNHDFNETYVKELSHFLACIKSNKKTINDAQDGLQTLKIALAIKKSSDTKKLQRLK